MKRLHELTASAGAAQVLAAMTRLSPRYLELGLRALRESRNWRCQEPEAALQAAVTAMIKEIENDLQVVYIQGFMVASSLELSDEIKPGDWRDVDEADEIQPFGVILYGENGPFCSRCGGSVPGCSCTTAPPGPYVAEPIEDDS